ncbi:MAG TPA: hypothetical protein VE994_08575 [Terriglobales bacterium]|nr:hypothetical protein [Terriglobales bacterium]
MPRFPFLQIANLADQARQFTLASYIPSVTLKDLSPGVDNLRHDVYLSPRFTESARNHISRVIARYGNVEDILDRIVRDGSRDERPPWAINAINAKPAARPHVPRKYEPAEFKKATAELQVAALNAAKAQSNVCIDLLARIAILKFLRIELTAQYSRLLERCRVRLNEGHADHGPGGMELRNRVQSFQISKKIILRRAGQDVFQTLREVEKETLARMRRSLFGDASAQGYEIFLNPLIFTEDGRDDYLCAERYVLLGNYERDPDRFATMREITCAFLKSLELAEDSADEERLLDGLLNAPENAQELVAGGSPDDSTPRGQAQKILLSTWVAMLESEGVMGQVVGAYEVVPLLAEYSPPINAQQLKNALISRTERHRVEKLIEDHGRLATGNLSAAAQRVASYSGSERAKIAGRFLSDFMRYHRDLRRLEVLNAAMERVNVLANDKLRDLSAANNTLYEFLLADEQRPSQQRVIHHVVLKADVRDSSIMTRSLLARGLNPASHFALNFYEPVNKLLAKYDATKVFIEGDAIILALLETEGGNAFAVGRACVLAREIIEVVRAYNVQSARIGLPPLELGIGISYQDSAPMYLMDGNSRIMISEALNESDRLSSCSKYARKHLATNESVFNVYSFLVLENLPLDDMGEFLMSYNHGGIHISAAAFRKLQDEISLNMREIWLPPLWAGEEEVKLYSGLVPVGAGIFHKLVVREGRVPIVDARDFSVRGWSDRVFYEVCSNSTIYEFLEDGSSNPQ